MYNPNLPPQDVNDLVLFLNEELVRIAQEYNPVLSGQHEILYSEPTKYKPGMVVYADGTSWNPGSGEGLYRRSLLNTWVFIG